MKKQTASTPVFAPKAVAARRAFPWRKVILAAVALLLVAALTVGLVLLFAPARTPVLTYAGITVDREMYAFWYSMHKTKAMVAHGLKTAQHDNATTWATLCSEKGKESLTWGEVLDAEVHREICLKLAAAAFYDTLGLTMSKNQRATIEAYEADMLKNFLGDEDAMEEALQKYGSTTSALRRCAVIDVKAELAAAYLQQGGLTTEEILAEYHTYYRRVKIVYINDKYYGRYENGVRVEEPINSLDQTQLTDRAELDHYYENGGMTEAIFEQYVARSDEEIHTSEAYEYGLYTSRFVDLFQAGVLEYAVFNEIRSGIEPGELLKVTTENGVRYIYCYEWDTAAYDRKENAPFFEDFYRGAAARALTARAALLLPDISTHEENRAGINMTDIPANVKQFSLCTLYDR